MAFQAEQSHHPAHARSIVDHRIRLRPPAGFPPLRAPPRHQASSHQLLTTLAGRSDDLTGGDLISHLLGQKPYSIHAR